MTKNRFLLLEPFEVGKRYWLEESEAHHLKHVLRAEIGTEILVMDGMGASAEARVTTLKSKQVEIEIQSLCETLPRPRVHLAFALPKPSALDFIFHRATEIGVQTFQPLLTQHSSAQKAWNSARWERVVREVCKQCEQPFFPTISPLRTLAEWLPSCQNLVYCNENAREPQRDLQVPSQDLFVLIGPEGGWAQNEVDLFTKTKGTRLGLGTQRLRSETAALVALTLVKHAVGEM